MNLPDEYEKIYPQTTWSDEELIKDLHNQAVSRDSIEIINVDSIETYLKVNNCKDAEEIIRTYKKRLS